METHLHADFISGHLELAEKTGAEIVISKKARAEFEHIPVEDGTKLHLGDAFISVLDTPGHTPEGVCYLLREGDAPMILFTGDTLFAGDVGRPDLMDKTIPADTLAEQLYFSLRDKIMTLPDDTVVYPAHGAGSSCGRALQDVESTTVGEQKQTNYALQPMTVEKFTKMVIEGQPPAPAYFSLSATINRRGAPDLSKILKNFEALNLAEFMQQSEDANTVVLDVRDEEEFAKLHAPGSLHIGLDGRYAEWVGGLVPISSRILIIAPDRHQEEAAIRCARVGFDNVAGYLRGGIQEYVKGGLKTRSYTRLDSISESDLERFTVIDIRRPSERELSRIDGSIHIPLHELKARMSEIPTKGDVLIQCAGGYRSVIASSILLNNGYTNIYDLRGGLDLLIEKNDPIVNTEAELIAR